MVDKVILYKVEDSDLPEVDVGLKEQGNFPGREVEPRLISVTRSRDQVPRLSLRESGEFFLFISVQR